MNDKNITVSIVEDIDEIREALRVLINGSEGFECVHVYPDAESAMEDISNGREVNPDLLDIKSLKRDARKYGKSEASREFSRVWYPGAFFVQKAREFIRGRRYTKNDCRDYLKLYAINAATEQTPEEPAPEETRTIRTPIGEVQIPTVWTPENIARYVPLLQMLGVIRPPAPAGGRP